MRPGNAPPGALEFTGELAPGAGAAAAAANGTAARKPHGFALLCPLTMGLAPTTQINADQRDAGNARGGRKHSFLHTGWLSVSLDTVNPEIYRSHANDRIGRNGYAEP